jgi:hypothetical protein
MVVSNIDLQKIAKALARAKLTAAVRLLETFGSHLRTSEVDKTVLEIDKTVLVCSQGLLSKGAPRSLRSRQGEVLPFVYR